MWRQGRLELVEAAEPINFRSSVIKVTTFWESTDLRNIAISLTISDNSRGCRWVITNPQNSFVLRGGFALRTLGTERALLKTRDVIARHQMMEAGAIFVKGVNICFVSWTSKLYTFRNNCVNRKEFWVSLWGLPHHLWYTTTARKLAHELKS